MGMPVRKICYNAKDCMKALMEKYAVERSVVVGTWLVLDPRLACWLLDPDKPPTNFQQCLNTVKINGQVRASGKSFFKKNCSRQSFWFISSRI